MQSFEHYEPVKVFHYCALLPTLISTGVRFQLNRKMMKMGMKTPLT